MQEDLLKELLEKTEQGNRLRKKQLLALRVCTLVLLVLVAVLGFLAGQARQLGGSVQQFAQVAAGLDVEGLNQGIRELKEQVEKLDVAGLNEAMQQVSGAAGQLEQAAQSFNSIGEAFGGWFGR